MLAIEYKNKFKDDYKLMKKSGKNMVLLHDVVEALANEQKLLPKYKDHALIGALMNLFS